MGLSLFAAVAVRIWIFDKIKSSVRLYPIALCALCLVLTFHTALLIKRNAAYRTESALLEDTLKKSPHKLRVMQNLVRALMLEGNPNRALAILQTMRAQNPNYYFTRVNLGTIYARFGDLASAEEEFKAALAIDSSAAEAHFNLGSIYALQGRLEEALTAYTSGESWYRARALQPPADALLNQIKLTLQLNLPERSEGVVKSFLAAYGDRTEIHLLLGQVYFKTGRLALAREEFLKADADPALSAQAANFLALIFIQENNLVAARAAFEKAVRLAPDRVEARVNLGKFLLESATDTAEGRRHLEYALRLTDDPRRREQILALLNQTPP
jgi:protein O-GlcNAc transferase